MLAESGQADAAEVRNSRTKAAARLSTRISAFGKALTGRRKSLALPEDGFDTVGEPDDEVRAS